MKAVCQAKMKTRLLLGKMMLTSASHPQQIHWGTIPRQSPTMVIQRRLRQFKNTLQKHPMYQQIGLKLEQDEENSKRFRVKFGRHRLYQRCLDEESD